MFGASQRQNNFQKRIMKYVYECVHKKLWGTHPGNKTNTTAWPSRRLVFFLAFVALPLAISQSFRMSSVHFRFSDDISVKLILIGIKFYITGR